MGDNHNSPATDHSPASDGDRETTRRSSSPTFGYDPYDRKANTTSSIFVSSTILAPNVDSIIRAVSNILVSQILEDQSAGKALQTNMGDLFFFSEEKYFREKPEAFDPQQIELLRLTPTVHVIFDFMRALFDCAKFSPECCIICLVYINRLIAFSGMPLHPTNWRPLVLCAFLVAQKVWDDRYLCNADFASIYPFFTNEEINRLEAKFLELIQYNVSVRSSLYAKYYFELRSLFKDNPAEFPLQPLDVVSARELEARSERIGIEAQSESERASKTIANGEIFHGMCHRQRPLVILS